MRGECERMKSTRLVAGPAGRETTHGAGVDKPVSELALGTAWYSLKDKDQWFGLMGDFVACGGTTLDTARGYGESEEVIGLWMETLANRDRIVIITKGGLTGDPQGYLLVKGFRETIESELTTSLECLRTDYIDLYFLHRDNPSLPVAEIVDCLNAELERGRIHAFGGSNWEPARVDEANEYADKHGLTGFAAVSNNLSLAIPTGPFYPGLVSTNKAGECWHIETGIPLFSWSSLARGFFTGRYSPVLHAEAEKIEDGLTKRIIEIYCTDENFERLHRAREIGKRKGGYSAIQVGLAWVLHRPFTVVPLVGPYTKEELASCVAALSIELTESESKWLNLET
jgi:aryl-alcohol dehydrogenase-like predicted oxidoreductase